LAILSGFLSFTAIFHRQYFLLLRGNLRGRDHRGDQDIDGRIILRWIFRKWEGGMDWIELAQGRGRWRALVNAVMNLLVP
jgi:hypothetical protein